MISLVKLWPGTFMSFREHPWMEIGEKEKWGKGARGASEVPVGILLGVMGGSNYCELEM